MLNFVIPPEFNCFATRKDLARHIQACADADAREVGYLGSRRDQLAYRSAVRRKLPQHLDSIVWNKIKDSPKAQHLFSELFRNHVRDTFLNIPTFDLLGYMRGDEALISGTVEGLPDEELRRRDFIGRHAYRVLSTLDSAIHEAPFEAIDILALEIEAILHEVMTPERWPTHFRNKPEAQREALFLARNTALAQLTGIEDETDIPTAFPILWAIVEAEEAEAAASELAAAA